MVHRSWRLLICFHLRTWPPKIASNGPLAQKQFQKTKRPGVTITPSFPDGSSSSGSSTTPARHWRPHRLHRRPAPRVQQQLAPSPTARRLLLLFKRRRPSGSRVAPAPPPLALLRGEDSGRGAAPAGTGPGLPRRMRRSPVERGARRGQPRRVPSSPFRFVSAPLLGQSDDLIQCGCCLVIGEPGRSVAF